MPNIKPISDLRSYTGVLDEVSPGSPVFLTKNGRGKFVIQDIADYERVEAERVLLKKLDQGMRSLEGRGGLSTEQLRAEIEERLSQEG